MAVRALNDVLEEGLPLHPLEEQRESVAKWRQIGLGIMGLGDMLLKMGLTYGSKEAVDFCHTLGFTMADTAIASSALLAKERGSYEQFCAEEVMETPYFKSQYDGRNRTACEIIWPSQFPASDHCADGNPFNDAGYFRRH